MCTENPNVPGVLGVNPQGFDSWNAFRWGVCTIMGSALALTARPEEGPGDANIAATEIVAFAGGEEGATNTSLVSLMDSAAKDGCLERPSNLGNGRYLLGEGVGATYAAGENGARGDGAGESATVSNARAQRLPAARVSGQGTATPVLSAQSCWQMLLGCIGDGVGAKVILVGVAIEGVLRQGAAFEDNGVAAKMLWRDHALGSGDRMSSNETSMDKRCTALWWENSRSMLKLLMSATCGGGGGIFTSTFGSMPRLSERLMRARAVAIFLIGTMP